MNSNNKLISVKGRERPLSKKQKQVFLSLSKYEFDSSFLKDTDYSKKNKITSKRNHNQFNSTVQEKSKLGKF